MILMHREAGGLFHPISTHGRRGPALICMLMVSVEAMTMGARRGGHAVQQVKAFFFFLWGTEQPSRSNPTWCGKASAGPHLVQPAGPFTHCLIRRASSSSLPGADTVGRLFKHRLVALISCRSAGGFVHLALAIIKCLAV